MLRFTFFLLFCFLCSVVWAQNTVSGTVRDSLGEALPFATLTLHDSTQKPIIAFTTADAAGSYAINLPLANKNYWLQARLLGYAPQGYWVRSGEIHQFVLKNQMTVLKEVIVREQRPISVKPDTITFNAKDFSDSTESVVEDLLKKIPGVEVSDDGTIKVQGKPIKKILIEGDDLFNQNYKMLSRNLSADVVDKVQIIDRFLDNKLLVGLVRSDEKALNITLKADKKNILFGNMRLGIGNDHRYTFLGNVAAFKNNFKTFNFLKFNSIGNDIMQDVLHDAGWSEGTNNVQEDKFSALDLEGLINLNRGIGGLKSWKNSFNRAGLAASSFLIKPSDKFRVRGLLYGLNDKNKQYQNNFYQYRLANGDFQLDEQNNFEQQPLMLNGNLEMSYDVNEKMQFRFQNETKHKTNQQSSSIVSNQNSLTNYLNNNVLQTNNSVEFLYRTTEKSIIIANLYHLYHQNQQGFTLEQNPMRPLPNRNDLFPQFYQDITKPFQYFSGAFQWLYVQNRYDLKASVQVTRQNNELNSSFLANQEKIEVFSNTETYRQTNYQANFRYTKLVWREARLFADVGINHYQMRLNSQLYAFKDTNFVYFLPKIGFKIGETGRSSFSTSYTYNLKNPTINELYGGSVMTDYRTFQRGSSVFLPINSHSFGMNYRFSDFTNGVAFNVNLLHFRSQQAYNNGIQISNLYNLYTRLPLTMPQQRTTLAWGFNKYIAAFSTAIKLHGQTSWHSYQNQVNSAETRENKAFSAQIDLTLNTVFQHFPNIYAGFKVNYSQNKTQTGKEIFFNKNIIYNPYLDITWNFATKSRIKLSNDVFYFSQSTAQQAYWFSNLTAYYDVLPNKLTLDLTLNNLLNTNEFITTAVNDYSQSINRISLLPRYLLIEAFWRF